MIRVAVSTGRASALRIAEWCGTGGPRGTARGRGSIESRVGLSPISSRSAAVCAAVRRT